MEELETTLVKALEAYNDMGALLKDLQRQIRVLKYAETIDSRGSDSSEDDEEMPELDIKRKRVIIDNRSKLQSIKTSSPKPLNDDPELNALFSIGDKETTALQNAKNQITTSTHAVFKNTVNNVGEIKKTIQSTGTAVCVVGTRLAHNAVEETGKNLEALDEVRIIAKRRARALLLSEPNEESKKTSPTSTSPTVSKYNKK